MTTDKSSLGEKLIAKILDSYGIKYFHDSPVEGLRGVKNGELRFDFIIPFDQSVDEISKVKQNEYCVIEYNGIFHFYIIEGKTSVSTISKQQMNDLVKDDFCREKGIDILWISYYNSNKSMKVAVVDFLFKHCRAIHNVVFNE